MLVSTNFSKSPISRVETGRRNPSLASFQPEAETLTYETYFGLNEKPFSLTSDSRFVYDSPSHLATCESLIAGIRRREGLLVLTGQIGTGKTTLCRKVLETLGRKTYSSLVPDPFASREDLLKMLLIDFGVLSIKELTAGPLRQASRTELGYVLAEFLDSLSRDSFVVVVIDEAQNLSLPLIEETRILFDTFGAEGRLQIVFVGQPELHGKLKLPEMRQVDQRVCGYHRLAPMSRDAVAGYIEHRLQVAGGNRERVLFPPAIVEVLHQRSGGVPRLINRICDRALQIAFERKVNAVDREILDTALIEVGSATLSPNWDSIIFAEPATTPGAAPATPAPALTAPPAAPAAPTAAPNHGAASFSSEIDRWVAQALEPSARALTQRQAGVGERRTAPGQRDGSSTAPKREARARNVKTDWPRDVRSETYLQRLARTWTKRAAIAAAVFAAINVGVAGASLLGDALTAPVLPQLPTPPALAAPGIALIEVPSAEPPVSVAAAVPVVASAPVSEEYLVSVGLFASRERADRLLDVLAQAGLPAMVRPIQLRRQQVQQIALGPYFSRTDAIADLRRLQALGGYDDANVIDGRRDSSAQ